MAQISGTIAEKIYPINAFLGLHEAPDGDTKLKMGEAAVCRNWRITRDGNLQRRPGLRTIETLAEDSPVQGMWVGYVGGFQYMLAACDGKLYKVYDGATGTFSLSEITALDTTFRVHIFGFSGKAYIMNGVTYKEWDGYTCQDVEGYVPLVSTGIGPDGTDSAGGVLLEQINKLSLKRRAWLSPDGTNATFSLPEKGLASIDYVKNTATGIVMPALDYTTNLIAGTITFNSAPASGTNTLEIAWTMPSTASLRSQVTSMRFSEIFSGVTDARVFIYGDGSNELFYSGMDYFGEPRADYFPDQNEIAVGDANTPVTSIIRHFSKLNVYKIDSTWVVSQSSLTLADGSLVSAYYCVPVNRAIGNVAPGQTHLVLNSPRTLFGDDLYEWKSNNAYSGNLTADERQARRISDRIFSTLRTFDFRNTVCWDDNDNQEYYICYNGNALVHNYAVDAWYFYDSFDAIAFANLEGKLYIGTSDGKILLLDDLAMDDDGTAIDAYWESGSISFGQEYNRKYSSALWVSVKPQTSSYVEISAFTDRKKDNAVKAIATGSGGFSDWDFSSFDFSDFDMTQVKRLRIKAKKFTYYKVIFKSSKAGSTATVLSANMRVRSTGYVK